MNKGTAEKLQKKTTSLRIEFLFMHHGKNTILKL